MTSSFMDWVADVAAQHPELVNAVVTVDGNWLDILLPDGRTFRFRPEQMVKPTLEEQERRRRLDRLISIGIQQAKPATQAEAPAATIVPDESADASATDDPIDFESDTILPIVRAADYFVSSHDHGADNSMIYLPLTDFIGVGLARDRADSTDPIFFADLAQSTDSHDIGQLFGKSVTTLRSLSMRDGQTGVELGIARTAGARTFVLTSPPSYQSSWFADLDMTRTLAESLSKEYDNRLPLFVPVNRTRLVIVFADEPRLPQFFSSLRGHDGESEAIYPLPHTVSADGWREWIPMRDHPATAMLDILRTTYRRRIYTKQVAAMGSWPQDLGVLKPYNVHRPRAGQRVSLAQWSNRDEHGSIPDTDFISFVRRPSGLPWDEDRGDVVTVRSRVAREVLADEIHPLENVWPPRWEIRGFPTPGQLRQLMDTRDPEF